MIWTALKFGFMAAGCAFFAGFATIWIGCLFVAIAGIRRPKGVMLAVIYALCSCGFGWIAHAIARWSLEFANSGQTKYFAAMTGFYFLVLITRRGAFPAFLAIARPQVANWNSKN